MEFFCSNDRLKGLMGERLEVKLPMHDHESTEVEPRALYAKFRIVIVESR